MVVTCAYKFFRFGCFAGYGCRVVWFLRGMRIALIQIPVRNKKEIFYHILIRKNYTDYNSASNYSITMHEYYNHLAVQHYTIYSEKCYWTINKNGSFHYDLLISFYRSTQNNNFPVFINKFLIGFLHILWSYIVTHQQIYLLSWEACGRPMIIQW